jgi:hypothetical protein
VKIALALAALAGCAVMIFFGEYAWALACEDGSCSAASGAGIMRGAAWTTVGSTIAAFVLDRLRIWWGVAAAVAFTGVMLLLWLLLFLAWVGRL